MKMLEMLIATILGSLIIATVSRPGQSLDQSSSLLGRQAIGANLENVMVGQAVVNALLEAGAPGGVAKVSDCNEAETYSFRPRDSSLRGVLDSIVSTDPRYTWEVEDDVINVIPSTGLPPFLTVRISRFDISQVESPQEALSQLLAIPEVQQAQLSLGSHAVQGGVYVFCPGCPPKETKKISINLEGVTVRESLNAIARAHGNAVWSFRQSECGGRKSFSLDFAAK
jgi:hypothetical protein